MFALGFDVVKRLRLEIAANKETVVELILGEVLIENNLNYLVILVEGIGNVVGR
ncbi:unnamed protein product [Meloidogyne enterolobii]|uniref:Uncharacterized protein n=1 Tax=Meloidogyne enterolobii TaxID=390850 RepID=A0ACB0ZKA8_MELEN